MSNQNRPDEGHLTEEEALAQAKADGIEFDDYWTIEGDELSKYDTEELAKEEAGDRAVVQHRVRRAEAPEAE